MKQLKLGYKLARWAIRHFSVIIIPCKGIKVKMNKSVLQKSIILILCSCILFSICPVYALAAENQEERVVRIGVPDDTYDKINGNGKRSGYAMNICRKSQVIPGGNMNM